MSVGNVVLDSSAVVEWLSEKRGARNAGLSADAGAVLAQLHEAVEWALGDD